MKDKIIKVIFVLIFSIIVIFFMIFTLTNNNTYSSVERRNLTTFPKLTINNLFDKNYYDQLTNAFNDQLAYRKLLVKGYFLFQFQHYYGDAVIGKNNQLYAPSQKVPNNYYKNLKNTTQLINEKAKEIDAEFIFLSIPRKDAYMINELPKTYNSSKNIYLKSSDIVKNNLDENIIYIDAYDVFTNNNVYNCYYSNDHHITPRCAYLLYKEINNYTGTNSYILEEEFTINKKIVNGAFNRQLGQSVKSKMEDLSLTPNKEINYTRYENDKMSNKKIYGKGNTYETAYMEGDMAYTRIETNKEAKNIMFVGASFTNIMEALSVPSYNRVLSIDYRHNKTGNSINYYVKKYNIDYVVFIPSQSNNAFSLERIKLHLGK